MFITRNEEEGIIKLHDNNKCIFELKYVSDELVCTISTDDKIVITKELDPYFYEYLSKFMENRYLFDNDINKKTDTQLVWLSDQSGDLSNPNVTNLINRLVIEKDDDKFLISYHNPFFQLMGIKKASHFIAFSPGGNGNYSKNIETGQTLQTEFALMFRNILIKKKIEEKRKNLNGIKRT